MHAISFNYANKEKPNTNVHSTVSYAKYMLNLNINFVPVST